MNVVIRGRSYRLDELSLRELTQAYYDTHIEEEKQAIAHEIAERAIRGDHHEK